MSQAVEANSMSADEYLAWEELQEEKHEYYHGEIFAMGGARREHVQVSLNIASALKQLLRGTPCRAYMSDMKLHVATMDTFFILMSSFHVIKRIIKQSSTYRILRKPMIVVPGLLLTGS